jgi:hypothetical protein
MRRAELLNTCTKGVLDPNLSERVDLSHYYNALAEAKNITIPPQGGFKRKPGTTLLATADAPGSGFRRRLRRMLQPVAVTADMITAPNGGTKANLISNDFTNEFITTNSVGSGTFNVFEIDLGVAVPVVFVDIHLYRAESAAADDRAVVEYWDGAAWVEMQGSADAGLSPRKNIRSGAGTGRTRRFGAWPGGHNGTPVSSRQFRFVIKDGSGLGRIVVQQVQLWSEKAAVSPVRIIPFARDGDNTYQLALTDFNIDVFRGQKYMASIPVPIAAMQIENMTFVQNTDYVFLFNEEVSTLAIQRQGAHDEWQPADVDFGAHPDLSSYGVAGAADEVVDVAIPGIVSGQSVVFCVGRMRTAPVAFTDAASFATAVAAALDALPGVASPGPTVTVRPGGDVTLRIAWSGANGGRFWFPVIPIVLDDIAIRPSVSNVERGQNPASRLMGGLNGYARCGAVVQGARFCVGGFRSAPQWVIFSAAGSLFMFDYGAGAITADDPIAVPINGDQVQTVNQIYVGRHLQVFTDSGEWFIENRVLSAVEPLNVVLATRYGLEPSVPLAFADGATLFLQRGGRTLRDFLFTDVEASYKAEALSLLAPHLISRTVDMAHRPARTTDAANEVYLVQDDGRIVLLNLLRAQEVVALMPYEMSGAVRAAACDYNNEVWLAVEHTASGITDLYLERLDAAHTLDAAMRVTSASPTTTVSGLFHLAGRSDVWVYADDDLVGPLSCSSGGVVTLPVAASEIIAGLATEVSGRLPTPRAKLQDQQPFRAPGRIYTIDVALAGTGQLQVSANNGGWRDLPLQQFGETRLDDSWLSAGGRSDLPMLQRLFTGHARVTNLQGFLKHPTVQFRQTVPAPLHVKSIRYEISHHG